MKSWFSGKKTIIGFLASGTYLGLIQFFGVPSEPAIWGFLTAWTGVSMTLHVDKAVSR